MIKYALGLLFVAIGLGFKYTEHEYAHLATNNNASWKTTSNVGIKLANTKVITAQIYTVAPNKIGLSTEVHLVPTEETQQGVARAIKHLAARN